MTSPRRFLQFTFPVALVTLVLLLLAACGASTAPKAPTTTSTTSASAVACPPGRSEMGCSVTGFKTTTPPAKLGGQKVFPDVSSFQGHPNWALAKSHISGAAAKLGEFTLDPDAAYNIGQFQKLGIRYVVYWFVRPTGCANEGGLIEHYAKAFHVGRIVLDEEVSGISGYAACLNPYVKAATGQDALVYRSAGNNFDSTANGLGCWVAAYGPSSPPACNGHLVAWQYTDGSNGFPTFIPGVGTGDVSNDYGIFGATPAPKPTRSQVTAWTKGRNVSYLAFTSRGCTQRLSRHDCWVYSQRVRYFQAKLDTAGPRPHCFGRARELGQPFCKVIRPYVSRWSHLRDASPARSRRHARYARLVKQNLY